MPPREARRPPADPDLHVAPASPADLAALARFHYRAGPPCPPVLILGARRAGELAGVLAVSMPVLNGPWRRLLWPGRFDPRPSRAAARALNRRLRTISRVIVDPRHRATGVATALVRAYLARPLTRYTESIAAVGAWSPFFAAAGMRAVRVPSARRDLALARDLRRLGVAPWTLVEASRAARQARRPPVRRALERWARDARATRRLLADAAPWELATLAAAHVLRRPVAYGFDARATPQGGHQGGNHA